MLIIYISINSYKILIMTLYTRISNFFFLSKKNNLLIKSKNVDNIQYIIRLMRRDYKRKNSYMRNNAALRIKEWRKENPFKPKDYSSAKKMYDDYFKMKNHISSFEELKESNRYIVNFRWEAPVRDIKFNSYFTNGPLVIHSSELKGEWFTNWRYLSDEELIEYEKNKNKIESIDKELEDIEKRRSELINKRSNIRKDLSNYIKIEKES